MPHQTTRAKSVRKTSRMCAPYTAPHAKALGDSCTQLHTLPAPGEHRCGSRQQAGLGLAAWGELACCWHVWCWRVRCWRVWCWRQWCRWGDGALWGWSTLAHGNAGAGGARWLGARRCGARWCGRRMVLARARSGALRGASAWGAARCGRGRSFARRTIALGAMAVGAMPGGVTGGFQGTTATQLGAKEDGCQRTRKAFARRAQWQRAQRELGMLGWRRYDLRQGAMRG